MPNLLEILGVLHPVLSSTNIARLTEITLGILHLSLPVTTRSISQASNMSLRTLERFYAQPSLPWLLIRLSLFKSFFFNPKTTYLFAGDETTEAKSGKSSYGLGRFYSSIFKRPIPSVSFLGISLVNTQTGKSSILSVEQLIKDKPSASKKKQKRASNKSKKPRGRKKGGKNKPYQEPTNLSYQLLKKNLNTLLQLLASHCPGLIAPYLVLDGFYGNQHYQKLANSLKLQLITKLKANAHLIFPYSGKQLPKGRKRHLGQKVNYQEIPKKYVVSLPKEHYLSQPHITVFQFQAYANLIKGIRLNIIVIQKTNSKNNKTTQSVLMSTDTTLKAELLIRYYSLRFQIEFDFRDAKQYFGLSSFKNYKQNQLTNAVNIAFTMCLIAQMLLEKYKEVLKVEKMSIWDLKACLRVQRYAQILLNNRQNEPEQFFKQENILDIINMEAVNL